MPLFARLSATDWTDGGWAPDDSVRLAKLPAERGTDLIDASSGGNTPHAQIPVGPGYQVPFAERIRAEDIVAGEQADVVFLARALLRDPHWPLRAANTLGADVPWPDQYARAKSWH